MDMENLIGETTEYDKKAALEVKKPKSWCKSVSAFANTLGGALIFGMADDGQIVGLTEPDSDAEKISEIIKTRMEPIQWYDIPLNCVPSGAILCAARSQRCGAVTAPAGAFRSATAAQRRLLARR